MICCLCILSYLDMLPPLSMAPVLTLCHISWLELMLCPWRVAVCLRHFAFLVPFMGPRYKQRKPCRTKEQCPHHHNATLAVSGVA